MVRIAITFEAFEAIAQTLPLGSVAVEREANAKDERTVWLEESGSTGLARCAGQERGL
jgi:hypothetical protein